MSTDTFHPFPRLPWDIRRIIWEMTVEPRTVAIRLAYGPPLNPNSKNYYTSVVSPTPVPATLHTCQEARDLGLYQRVSTDSFGCSDPEPYKYFWLNWDTDLIDVHDCPFATFDRIAPLIKRLKLESEFITDFDREFISSGPSDFEEFSHIFPNVEELHVVCCHPTYSLDKLKIYFASTGSSILSIIRKTCSLWMQWTPDWSYITMHR
ncbi:hypothetical protein B0H65DRAFT_232789 [Neurospora tetraspora]|uniref:2EXR domain-containing protein n=1 Tax=Neurospora tetraspora TaxID=94610 RepID=A0AAE0JE90_9PEZI|nr:hypothetical protein B0H65DRAFT_232789 [Neurospora tetraspora]